MLTSKLPKKPAPRPWPAILSAAKNLFFFGGSIHCKSRFFVAEPTLERNVRTPQNDIRELFNNPLVSSSARPEAKSRLARGKAWPVSQYP